MKLISFLAFLCFILPGSSNAISMELKLHPAIGDLCKSSETDLTQCLCPKFSKLPAILKNGSPEMNLARIDPIQVEYVKLDLSSTQTFHVLIEIYSASVYGLSENSPVVCKAEFASSGLHLHLDLMFPLITVKARFKAVGDILLLHINSDGDFLAEFSDFFIKSDWDTTKFTKNNRIHLRFKGNITDLTVKNMKIQYTDLFPNQTALNNEINEAVNNNMDLIYNDIAPLIVGMVRKFSTKLFNDVFDAFPFDVLFPPDN